MGKGSIQRKNYITKAGYFCEEGYDKNSGNYWLFIEPLHGWENKRFFYVEPLKGNKGIYEITGEGYILTEKEQATNHRQDLRKELEKVDVIYYYFTDDTGQVFREETAPLVKTKNK